MSKVFLLCKRVLWNEAIAGRVLCGVRLVMIWWLLDPRHQSWLLRENPILSVCWQWTMLFPLIYRMFSDPVFFQTLCVGVRSLWGMGCDIETTLVAFEPKAAIVIAMGNLSFSTCCRWAPSLLCNAVCPQQFQTVHLVPQGNTTVCVYVCNLITALVKWFQYNTQTSCLNYKQ